MKPFLITPDEKFIKKVRPIIEKTLEKCSRILKSKKLIRVNVGFTNDAFVIKSMHGVSGETLSSTEIRVRVNTSAKDWEII